MAKRITDEQMNVTMSVNGGNQAKKALGDLQQGYRRLKEEEEDLRKAKQRLIAEGDKESANYKQINGDLKKLKVQMTDNKDEQAKYRKEIGLSALSVNELTKRQRGLRAQMNAVTPNSEDWNRWNKELQETSKRLKEVRDDMRFTEDGMGDTAGAAEELGAAAGDIFQGLRTGDFQQVNSGFTVMRDNMKSLTKQAWAFIKTPFGATLATLATIGAIAKQWWDYNVAISRTIKLTQQLTEFDGERLSKYRASVQATANTFDKEYNEVLRAANALSKQMNIEQEEALDLINQGFVRGADASGQFLDNLTEYPKQFENAGFSAQDFIDITTQEAKGGTYADKLVDSLKEADISLQEQTTATRDAIVNAFGAPFANEILRKVDQGEMTTKEALIAISEQAKETGLSQQQQAQLTADIFRGAGEDAGGFLEIMGQIDEAFSEQSKDLNDNEEATQRLVEANKEYEQALADLFDESQSGFPAMLTNIKAIGTEIKTNVLRGIQTLFTSLEQIKVAAAIEGQSEAVKDIYENMKQFGTTAAEEAEVQMGATLKNIERLEKEIDDVGFFSAPGTEKALEKKLAEQKAYYKELVAIAKGESEALAAYEESLLDGNDNNNADTDGGGNSGGNEDEDDKNVDDEAKKRAEKEIAIRKKVAEQLKEWENERNLTDEENEIEKLEAKFEKLEEDAAGEAELLARLEEEKLAQIQEVRDKFSEERLEKERQEKERLAEIERKFKNDLIKAETDLQSAKADLYQAGISALKGFFGDSKGIYAGLLALEKALAINEVIVNSSKAIAQAQANHASVPPIIPGTVIPNPMYPVSLATMTKNIAATKISAATQIASITGTAIQELSGVQGHEDGLYPNYVDVTRTDGRRFRARNMGRAGTRIVSEPSYFSDNGGYIAAESGTELIVDNATYRQLDPAIIENILQTRDNVRGYATGRYPDNPTPAMSAGGSDPEMKALLRIMAERFSQPIQAQVLWGYDEQEQSNELNNDIANSSRNGNLTP